MEQMLTHLMNDVM